LGKQGFVSRLLSRRTVLKSALGAGLGLRFVGLAAGATDAVRTTRPQAGDFFTFSLGDRRGQLITARDLSLGGPPLIVYPLDSSTQTVRDGSRLNRVLVVRFAQEELTEQTRAAAAEGIVGYSAVCTHTGCDVSGWKAENKCFVCPCHTSTFDPKDKARVVSGPAPRPLAMLPLRLVEGKVVAAGSFSGRVGAEQK
jgi:Rieske Fe-S protein